MRTNWASWLSWPQKPLKILCLRNSNKKPNHVIYLKSSSELYLFVKTCASFPFSSTRFPITISPRIHHFSLMVITFILLRRIFTRFRNQGFFFVSDFICGLCCNWFVVNFAFCKPRYIQIATHWLCGSSSGWHVKTIFVTFTGLLRWLPWKIEWKRRFA